MVEALKNVLGPSQKIFSPQYVQEALRLLQQSRVAISYTNDRDPSQFFVVSGIVSDQTTLEARMTYRKRLEFDSQGPYRSQCQCSQWTEGKHCPHTIALYLFFKLNELGEDAFAKEFSEEGPPLALNTSFGVVPPEYGLLINGPHKLEGAPPSGSYSSLQYLLSNKKVVSFPIPKKLDLPLVVFINTPTDQQLSTLYNMDFPTEIHNYSDDRKIDYYIDLKFGLKGKTPEGEDVILKRISVFEHLYVFNWDTGEAFHLENEVKDFIHRLRLNRHDLNVNEILRLAARSKDLLTSGLIEIIIQGKNLADIKQVDTTPRLHLNPFPTRSQVEVELIFTCEHQGQEVMTLPPPLLSKFCFNGGSLGSFRKKSDGHDFLKKVLEWSKSDRFVFTAGLLRLPLKKEWQETLEELFGEGDVLVYDGRHKLISKHSIHNIKALFIAMLERFSSDFFRFSTFEENKLSYRLSASQFFAGISRFYQDVAPYGVEIYYDRKQISSWQSRISFERRSLSTNWFDLSLNMTKDDLDIIRKASLEEGVAITKAGLILLSPEQKDLLRFMKKYTQYEVKDDQQDEEGVLQKLQASDAKNLRKFIIPFNRSRIFELFELRKLGIDGALNSEEVSLCERLMNLKEIPEYPLPDTLKEIMRPYQKQGYYWLRFLYENKLGACLADDMGLGKTLQAIAFLQAIHKEINHILIVCPVSILLNWENEFNKFSNLGVQIYHGGERAVSEDSKIILTSYGVMKKEADDLLSRFNFDVLILDEVQQLKNIRSLGAYAARKIKASFRICLTGTPVENDLAEFYNILDLAIPGIWGDLQFIRTTSTKKSRLVARKNAAPFILRRTKGQVLTDLPPKTENNIVLEMSASERQRYVMTLTAIKTKLSNTQDKKRYGEILKGLLQLRQLCLWQNEHGFGRPTQYKEIHSTKINFLLETLDAILQEGHQAIIFSQFTTYLDIIQFYFQEKHWKYSRIDGGQQMKKRHKQVELFQDGTHPLFLISLKAGGVGLNLTAASYVFIMDPWWNPAVEQQAIDRAHRIGQENPLTVYRPIIKNSVEEKVLDLQKHKKELFMDLLPENEGELFTGKLSMKDFEHLFSL